jgi:hypothetical protein
MARNRNGIMDGAISEPHCSSKRNHCLLVIPKDHRRMANVRVYSPCGSFTAAWLGLIFGSMLFVSITDGK